MTETIVSVLVAEGQRLLREGLVNLFSADPSFTVVGQAADGQEAYERVGDLNPDVALLDVALPVIDGIGVTRRIREFYPRTEVVFLAANYHEERVREAFEAGARGYLLKQCSYQELSFAVRKASTGDYYLSGPVSHDMVAEYVKPLLNAQKPGGLVTKRERELARLLADGYSTKEAADVLNISAKTAEAHRASIMKKLNAKNVTDIVKYCIRNQIIEP